MSEKKPWKDFTTILINGNYLNRKKFTSKVKGKTCEKCHVPIGSFHVLGCVLEKQVGCLCEAKFLVDCVCDVRVDEKV